MSIILYANVVVRRRVAAVLSGRCNPTAPDHQSQQSRSCSSSCSIGGGNATTGKETVEEQNRTARGNANALSSTERGTTC